MSVLIYIAQQITTYIGCTLFIMGLFGSIMIIFIFSKDPQYRKTPCTFYLLMASIHDLLLIVILALRIVSVGFGIDLTRMSVAWCKTRFYLFCTWAGILLTCQCLATFDQFLITSKNPYFRRFSTIKTAYVLVGITIIFWWLQSIPWLIYQDISPTTGACIYTSRRFLRYVVFFGLFGVNWLHSIFLILFGLLAYRNIGETIALSSQNAHRQMTRIVCIQVIPVILSGIFNGGWNVYALATYKMAKSVDLLEKEYLFNSSIALLAYLGCATKFYLFLMVSSRFRHVTRRSLPCWRTRDGIIAAYDLVTGTRV